MKFHDDERTLESSSSTIYTDECTKAFTSFNGIKKATCKSEQNWNAELLSYSYLVRIDEWSLRPYENNLFYHNGNPDISEFGCDVSLLDHETITKPYCEITDVINSNLPGRLPRLLPLSLSLSDSISLCVSLSLSLSVSLSDSVSVCLTHSLS
jgi:hypothetical protein